MFEGWWTFTQEMIMKRFFLLTLILISTQSFSQGFQWKEIFTNGDISIFVDTSRIKKIDKNYRFWVLHNYQSPRQNGYFSYQSMIEYQEVSCREDKTLLLKQTMYVSQFGNGTSYELKMDDKWNFNTPGTRLDLTLRFVCQSQK